MSLHNANFKFRTKIKNFDYAPKQVKNRKFKKCQDFASYIKRKVESTKTETSDEKSIYNILKKYIKIKCESNKKHASTLIVHNILDRHHRNNFLSPEIKHYRTMVAHVLLDVLKSYQNLNAHYHHRHHVNSQQYDHLGNC